MENGDITVKNEMSLVLSNVETEYSQGIHRLHATLSCSGNDFTITGSRGINVIGIVFYLKNKKGNEFRLESASKMNHFPGYQEITLCVAESYLAFDDVIIEVEPDEYLLHAEIEIGKQVLLSPELRLSVTKGIVTEAMKKK